MLFQGEEELDQNEKKKLKKLKAMEESDDEEEGRKNCLNQHLECLDGYVSSTDIKLMA